MNDQAETTQNTLTDSELNLWMGQNLSFNRCAEFARESDMELSELMRLFRRLLRDLGDPDRALEEGWLTQFAQDQN